MLGIQPSDFGDSQGEGILADAHTAARLLPSLFLFVLTPNVAGDDDSPRLLLVLACVAEDSVLSP